MYMQSKEKNENKIKSTANNSYRMPSSGRTTCQLREDRNEIDEMQKKAVNDSPRIAQLKTLQRMVNDSHQVKGLIQFSSAINNCIQRAPKKNKKSSAHVYKVHNPQNYKFTTKSALNAIEPISRGEAQQKTGRGARTGVRVGHVGSYGYVQYLEKTGDRLTGDHQPSGAAVKESIRISLHKQLPKPLTRERARNAYRKAITIVMPESWHRLYSRTYGGRNTKTQIEVDAQDLATASVEDWKKTVPELEKKFSPEQIQKIWEHLCKSRESFFKTGNAQAGTLKS